MFPYPSPLYLALLVSCGHPFVISIPPKFNFMITRLRIAAVTIGMPGSHTEITR